MGCEGLEDSGEGATQEPLVARQSTVQGASWPEYRVTPLAAPLCQSTVWAVCRRPRWVGLTSSVVLKGSFRVWQTLKTEVCQRLGTQKCKLWVGLYFSLPAPGTDVEVQLPKFLTCFPSDSGSRRSWGWGGAACMSLLYKQIRKVAKMVSLKEL